MHSPERVEGKDLRSSPVLTNRRAGGTTPRLLGAKLLLASRSVRGALRRAAGGVSAGRDAHGISVLPAVLAEVREARRVPSGFTQWPAEAGPATISEDITANAAPKTIFFFLFMCGSPPSLLAVVRTPGPDGSPSARSSGELPELRPEGVFGGWHTRFCVALVQHP
jgi:hypothetical protein